MHKTIYIKFLPYNITIEAQIFLDSNYSLSKPILDVLPYRSVMTHTLVSGGNIYHFTPITDRFVLKPDKLTNRQSAPIGTIFLPDPQSLFIKYDQIFETNDFPAIGRVVPSDITKLIEIGKLCWQSVYKTKEIIQVEITSEDSGNHHIKTHQIFPDTKLINNIRVKDCADKIIMEATKIWLCPPDDLKKIFQNKDVYLSVKHFVASTLQHLGILGSSNSLLQISDISQINIDYLRLLTDKIMCKYNFYFLKDCGLEKLHELSEEFYSIINLIDNKKEYFLVLSLFSTYISQLHLWSLNYFPWYSQDFHGYPN